MLQDHPLRRELIGEMHARPFLGFQGPAEVLHLAFKPEGRGIGVDHAAEYAHLAALLRSEGAAAPDREANHLVTEFRDLQMKWERHTEFVSYTFIRPRAQAEPFSDGPEDWLPHDWLSGAPGRVIAAAWLHAESVETAEEAEALVTGPLREHFQEDSLATAWVTGRRCAVAGDFRLDPRGLTRFAMVSTSGLGARRIGRVAQRLVEIETYRAMAMLALPIAREMSAQLPALGEQLAEIIDALASDRAMAEDRKTLDRLTRLSADLERLSATSAFRFNAARAYSSIVEDRIRTLREEKIAERQSFEDFMLRRFSPAMRTCEAADARLETLSKRAERAGNLLRTRVDVSLEEQNQELLLSMNRRAELQLRLQQTVEGLSVVAISYYAVSLAGYLVAPLAKAAGLSLTLVKALVAVPIIAGVWFMVRQIRNHVK